jgi:CheY-like chemotaxis protein
MLPISAERVPRHLVDAILGGRCIAFVGAGFSQPAVPGWPALLSELGRRLGMPVSLASNTTALEYELIGQALRQRAGDAAEFETHVKAILESRADNDERIAKGRETVRNRCKLLQSIPFKAILTTNFDAWLPGENTGPSTYWNVLREDLGRWWEFPIRASDPHPRVPIIKLHGDANGNPDQAPIVLGRTDYRRRVYGENGYTSFIRAAFASYTVLFLGVSFTDAYLNELRSETLHLLQNADRNEAWGYAIMKIDDPKRPFVDLFREHESIEVLECAEFAEFDLWLQVIAARTSAQGRLRELLTGKRIVWIDSRPENNALGRELFETCGATVHALTSEAQLADAHRDADVLVTQFGHDLISSSSRAFRVLETVAKWPSRPPVIVFASPDGPVDANRRECLRRGAGEYATQWSELYRLIETLLSRRPGNTSA